MRYMLAVLFLMFAIIEYNYGTSFCSTSNLITGNMWFMWLMMSLMCLDNFIKLIKKK